MMATNLIFYIILTKFKTNILLIFHYLFYLFFVLSVFLYLYVNFMQFLVQY